MPTSSTAETATPPPMQAVVGQRVATWRQLLPSHRIPVIAKTPLMIALGVYLSGGAFGWQTVGETMVLVAALWAALYVLNEATDIKGEQRLAVAPTLTYGLLAFSVALSLGAAWLSWQLSLLMGAMVVSQVIYCLPPLRLKQHWWAILALSGTLNPVLRLLCGVLWGKYPVPLFTYAVFILLHLGAATRTRILHRERDRGYGYSVAPVGAKPFGMVCNALGVLGAGWLCIQRALPPLFLFFWLLMALFSLYAWSDRARSATQLRRAWLWFALLTLLALALLHTSR